MTDFSLIELLWGQTQTRLQFQWPLEPLLLIGIAVVFLLNLWLVLRNRDLRVYQRIWLAGLRMTAMVVLIGMLPGWASHEEQTGKSELIVLVDSSLSMQVEDEFAVADLSRLTQAWLADNLGDQWESQSANDDATVSIPRIMLANAFLGTTSTEVESTEEAMAGELHGLQENYDVVIYEVGEGIRRQAQGLRHPVTPSSLDSSEGSALGQAIVDVLQRHRGKSIAAIVYLTDGQSNVGVSLSRAAELARQRSVPVFVPQIASVTQQKTIQLMNPSGPERVLLDQPVVFEVDVVRHGNTKVAQDFPFRVISDQDQQEVLASFKAGQNQTSLSIRHIARSAGEQTLRVEFAGDSDHQESSSRHQRYLDHHEFRFVVHADAIKVLIVEQFPRFEFRALEDLLSRATNVSGQPRFDVSVVLGTADPQLALEDNRLFTGIREDRDWLFGFDVIVIGDVPVKLLTLESQALLVDFVQQRGGGLVFVAGERSLPGEYNGQPIAELFPADVANYETMTLLKQPASLLLSQLGERTALTTVSDSSETKNQIWRNLPGPFWLTQSPILQTGAQVLVYADTDSQARLPLITQHFSGSGRIIFQGFDSTWRWRQVGELDDPHAGYWIQLINYLAGSSVGVGRTGVELSLDSQQIFFGDSVDVQVRFLNPLNAPTEDSVVVELAESTGKSTIVRLARSGIHQGRFHASLHDLRVGHYTIRLVSPVDVNSTPTSLRLDVESEAKEQMDSSADIDALANLVTTSGGRFYTLNQWNLLRDEIPQEQRVVIRELNRQLLWNANWLVFLFVLLITAEWGLRRRWYN